MDVNPEADSGQETGNTGAKENDSAGLDKALNAALQGFDDTDVPFQVVQAKQKEDARKSKTKDAGDIRTSEEARPPEATPEANPNPAAPEGQAVVREAPKHWPEERRKAFAGWPKEVQDHALAVDKDLQSGFTKKSQELSDKAKYADTIRGAIDEATRQQMAQVGMDDPAVVRYWGRIQQFATRDPVGYLRWAADNLNVTFEQLAHAFGHSPQGLIGHNQQHQQPAQRPSTGNAELDALLVDPEVAQLRSTVDQYGRTLQQLQGYIGSQYQAQQEWQRNQQLQHVQSLQKQWNDFRSEQDETGQLAYPHADALMQPMGALMDTHPVLKGMPDGPEKLKKAYQMALQADPELSKPLIEAEVAKRFAEAEKKREAERAKKAAAVKPASGAPAVPRKKGGLDAALEAAWAQSGRD